MGSFGTSKPALNHGSMQQPSPSTSQGDFLPRYEEAVNVNLRNFDLLEGQVSDGASEHSQQSKEKMPMWKRCLLFGIPLLLVLIVVTGVVLAVFDKENYDRPIPSPSSSISPEAISTSITLTKRSTVTITQTYTYTAPIAPVISDQIGSFYASWSSEATQTSASTAPLPSINMDPSTSSTTPLPTTDFNAPVPATSSVAPVTTTVPPPPSTLSTSTYSRPGPTGENFCGLPGTFCPFKRDVDTEDDGQPPIKIVTVWKHLTFTTSIATTHTVAPFPASVMEAYDSYLRENRLSVSTTYTGAVLSSVDWSATSTVPPEPAIPASSTAASSTLRTCVKGAVTVAQNVC